MVRKAHPTPETGSRNAISDFQLSARSAGERRRFPPVNRKAAKMAALQDSLM